MRSQQRLFGRYLKDIKPGTLTWIGLRPAHRADIVVVEQCQALANLGLEGDHRASKTPGSGRQVTLISEEYIQQIAHFTGRSTVDPVLLRRNLVVTGINLTALRYQQFSIGDALFEANALCHPCRRMEQELGKGAVAAMLGHGGLCCKVLKSGQIRTGDRVKAVFPQQELF